ncbi:MAG: hypothetical protein ACRECQ_16360, partial [Burkholderiaceae bacterium]
AGRYTYALLRRCWIEVMPPEKIIAKRWHITSTPRGSLIKRHTTPSKPATKRWLYRRSIGPKRITAPHSLRSTGLSRL